MTRCVTSKLSEDADLAIRIVQADSSLIPHLLAILHTQYSMYLIPLFQCKTLKLLGVRILPPATSN
jgi:hypothetical protein